MGNILIGADIGGTNIKLGLFDTGGTLLKKLSIPTDREDCCAAVLPDIARTLGEVLPAEGLSLSDCLGIGFGVPGPVMPDGYVEQCPNLFWHDRYPARELSSLLGGLPAFIANDANAAALGEAWRGGAKGIDNAVMITLGTGVGGGIILDGNIVNGVHGLGGEIGHLFVRPEEETRCNCGARGCLEQVCAAPGMVREAKRILEADPSPSAMRELGERLTAKDICDLGRAGDRLADRTVDTMAHYLGLGMSLITLVADPEVFVIGGGVSAAGEYLLEKVRRSYDSFISISRHRARVVKAELGNDAGIYGAARLAMRGVKE